MSRSEKFTLGMMVLIAGALSVLVGLAVGFWPRSNGQVAGTMYADSCGSAFLPDPEAMQGLAGCDYYLSGPRGWAIGLLVVGFAGLVIGLLTIVANPRVDAPRKAHENRPSSVDDLERLTRLHASGALSDEEFEAGKKRALGLG